MKRLIAGTLALGVALAAAAPAHAWEPETNAGLTERAARASKLHAILAQAHGRALGLYDALAVAPADAPKLALKLGKLDPTQGGVPDGRGRQAAISWLITGALLEELPGDRSVNHFLDPVHKTGLTRRTVGTVRGLKARAVALLAGAGLPAHGRRADEWLVAPDNDLGLARFWTELEAATLAGPSAQRERHLAYALVCAGAIVSVLEDLASPSRVRDDLLAHLMPLGGGPDDLGSRTERLAALAYGRLGVPAPQVAPDRATWRDFFTAADGQGLADVVHARAFSQGTLPPEIPLAAPLAAKRAALAGVVPTLGVKDLAAATPSDNGTPILDARGVCLVHARDNAGTVEWLLPDECVVDQVGALLPLAGGYAAGLLDWLFRGTLAVSPTGTVVRGLDLGAGTLVLLVDDAKGVRRQLGPKLDVAAGKKDTSLTQAPAVPAGTVRLIALFRGKDARGDELVAVGQAPTPAPAPATVR